MPAIPVWNLLNEDCSDISDWTDNDQGTAVSEVSPADQFRFDTNLGAGVSGNVYAQRYRDIGNFPDIFTVEFKVYHDSIGTVANDDFFRLDCYQADEGLLIRFASDGLFIYDTDSGYTEVGTNLVKSGGSAEWQTWRFVATFTGVTGNATCDVYLKDSTHNWFKVGTSIHCGYVVNDTDGMINLFQYGYTTDNMVTHIDHFKIATGAIPPTGMYMLGCNF